MRIRFLGSGCMRRFVCFSLLLALIGCGKTSKLTPQELRQMVQAGRVLRAHAESDGALRGNLRDETTFVCYLPSPEDRAAMASLMKEYNVDLIFQSDSAASTSGGAWGLVRSVR